MHAYPQRHQKDIAVPQRTSVKTIRLNTHFNLGIISDTTLPEASAFRSRLSQLIMKKFSTLFWFYANLLVTPPHQDATGTKVCTDDCLCF